MSVLWNTLKFKNSLEFMVFSECNIIDDMEIDTVIQGWRIERVRAKGLSLGPGRLEET